MSNRHHVYSGIFIGICSMCKTTFFNRFSWCSGYHICLTHRRSPVRSRAKTSNFFVSYFHFIYLFDFQKYTPVFLYLFIFNPFIFVYIWLILQCSKVKFNRWKKLWIFHKTIFLFFSGSHERNENALSTSWLQVDVFFESNRRSLRQTTWHQNRSQCG